MAKSKQAIVDSVHQRLLNKARETNRPFNELLQYYAMEKFLLRMSKLPNAEDFVLKGALLLRAAGISELRATRDIDVLKYGSSAIPDIVEIFRKCCNINIEGDQNSNRITNSANRDFLRGRHQEKTMESVYR
ncbi:nucleotidyl transferase AbiEii/AbiGii toxin family protein [Fodinibius sp.]|uniref:nucleotidyl transferase AbiEii/AbiGii toxin family protein n=1 Tax=Fodinibius sp. TaxID=1872440 RepID=UPI00356B562A